MNEPRNKKIEITPEITRQLAIRRAVGISLRDLEAEFGFSRPVINRTLSSQLAKDIVKSVTDDAIASAVTSVRKAMSDMTEEVSRVLLAHLKEDNLEAVKIILKGLGMEQVAAVDKPQTQAIQIIMPGSKAEKEVENG